MFLFYFLFVGMRELEAICVFAPFFPKNKKDFRSKTLHMTWKEGCWFRPTAHLT
jgi:hypothetical protein